MILLIIGVVGGILSLILGYTKSIATVNFAVNSVALYFLLKAKKSKLVLHKIFRYSEQVG